MPDSSSVPRSEPLRRRQTLALGAGALLGLPLLGYSSTTAATSAGASAAPAVAGGVTGQAGPWLSTGTKAMAGQAFANPFAGQALEGACRLSCEATLGPCHVASPERMDLSDGHAGQPMRLALRVVNEACEPVPNAVVEVWHTNAEGGYSGELPRMCTKQAEDAKAQFFRGWQRADAQGVVNFNTCYPGWYRGRAVHIHFRVLLGDYQGDGRAQASVISQLLFDDALNTAVFAQHPLYQTHGQPDINNTVDSVMGGDPRQSDYHLKVQHLPSGVMLAHQTLVLRSQPDKATCAIQGRMGNGGGGMGGRGRGQRPLGPPPDGMSAPPSGMPRPRQP